ncbi:MAG TPA: ribulose-phosphate 3-epimerase [Longimicrobiales bacterium]|nr:ribulose-phosphate 3-epimerase [Longimicrobiales bacterium]
MSIRIAPSILSADFARLADAVQTAEEAGADWIHVDVMDGHFVPNITIGVPVVAALRRVTDLPLDVHLMIEEPARYVDAFVDAGADWLTVHQEADVHLHRTVERIREKGAHPGVSINPATPVAALHEILPYLDMVLVMSVNPGFGGQRFIPTSTGKINALRRQLDDRGLWPIEIQVDGGISPSTAGEVSDAGATVLVAGAAVFNEAASVADNIAALRQAVERAA